MGFSSNLQGRAAHEALLCRQDAELRLLDTMRRCLATKVKCDREYAVAITSVALQGQKLERAEDLVGSLVAQAWKNMLEELENTAKLIKQNADLVESKSLDKLNSLYAEKRRARKHYQEEHNRIVAQFTHGSENDYYIQDCLASRHCPSYGIPGSRSCICFCPPGKGPELENGCF